MTHALDFSVAPELKAAFEKQLSEDCSDHDMMRTIKAQIADETFVLAGQLPWETGEGHAAALSRSRTLLSEAEACFLLLRLECDHGSKWALYSFVPDEAPARDKMLYSSSTATLRRSMGGGDIFSQEVHFSALDEVVLAGDSPDQEAMMTAAERLAIEEDRTVAREAAAGASKVSSMGGLAFPLTSDAASQLEGFQNGTVALVLLSIQAEQVVLRSAAATATTADLAAALPADAPCYALFRWPHEHEGAQVVTIFFYSCPEASPVKLKMLHASSKGTMLQAVEGMGISVAKSLEGIEASELADGLLMAELYPSEGGSDATPTITKAAPRGGRKLNSRNKR